MLELGVTFSFAQLLIDAEIAKMVKRSVAGIDVRDETLAVEVIKTVGAGKDFLAQKHTRQFMNKEQSKPSLIDRNMRGAWQKKGGKDWAGRAEDAARELLKTHIPAPLDPAIAAKLRDIIKSAEEELNNPN